MPLNGLFTGPQYSLLGHQALGVLMIRLPLALCSVAVTIALTQLVSAADLAPVYKSPAPIASNWSGFYVGGSLGGRWADSTWTTTAIGDPQGPADPTTTPASFNGSTFRIAAYLGYNWQFAPQWLVGLEADAGWAQRTITLAGIPGTFGTGGQGVDLGATAFDSSSVKLGWDGSLRGRIGFLVAPTWLLYATGGLAWQHVSINATCDGSFFNASWCVAVRNEAASTTRLGWTVGGGIETLFWNNWLLRAEYRYADYGSIDHGFFADASIDQVVMTQSLRTNTGLVGLAYKF